MDVLKKRAERFGVAVAPVLAKVGVCRVVGGGVQRE